MKSNTAAVLLVLSLASCESTDSSLKAQKNAARMGIEKQRSYEAELVAERNGPRMAPGDYKQLTAALSFKHEKEQLELARYARFQMEQKLALAQASSPKMLVTSGGDISSDYRQVEYGNSRGHREFALNRGQGFAGTAYSTVQRSSAREFPAQFYRRQIQEDSATQAEATYNANQSGSEQSDQEAPYAIPVPGRPGYVTMPPKMGGYIDVRGYAPGALVMDPWTKTVIRVP